MVKDDLLELIYMHLKQTSNLNEKADELIRKVSAAYCLSLMSKGNIPFQLLDAVIEDIQSEALEIYRKKTYGHLTLRAYREFLLSKEK